MQTNVRQTAVLMVSILALLMVQGLGATAQSLPLVASANGEGILRVGQEKFKVGAVVVKLLEDSKAEITLVSDITIFVSGTWSGKIDGQDGIKLVITGGANGGGLAGDGKLSLREDKKSVATLALRAFNRQTKRNIEVTFKGK